MEPLVFLGIALMWALPFVLGYWVIRLAVRHAIADADARRRGAGPL